MARSQTVPERWAPAAEEPVSSDGVRRRERRGKRSKKQLLPSISLELKGPLGSIRAASQAMTRARSGTLSRKQEKMLRIITEESSTLVCLIEDLLDMAEIESGKLALVFRRCSVPDVVQASLCRHRSRFRQKGVELLDMLPALCPPVRGDATRLRQVFDYLFLNALKFTPPGGRVEIKLAGGSAPAGASTPRPSLSICVCDTGEGILRDDLAGLFDATRAGVHRSPRASGGNGLGLSFVRFLVEAHGGEIWAESGPGPGVSFFLSLPQMRG